jgi:hypothetical protein
MVCNRHDEEAHMHPPLVRSRVVWVPVLGALLLGGAVALRTQAQTTERHNPLRAAYMRAHFYQAMLLHDAVARGDLQAARTEATRLYQHSPTVPMPVGAEAFQGALTQMARQASTASTLDEAAQATATILGTCGQCHKAMGARAAVPPSAEIKVGGLVGHMLLHQHGADAFVEGLVAPSDTAWGEGVRTFASPKLDADEVHSSLRSRMGRSETDIAQLAGRAAQAHRTRDREGLYGKLLATCGDCHATQARHAGPDRR